MTIETHGKDWRWLQDEVVRLLNQIPGCIARVNQRISGARGTFQIDVWAEFGHPLDVSEKERAFHGRIGHRFVFKMLVECKAWKRKISQDRLLTLRGIVEDVGADRGVLISNYGVQRGAQVLLNSPIKLYAYTLNEFRTMIGQRGALGLRQDARPSQAV